MHYNELYSLVDDNPRQLSHPQKINKKIKLKFTELQTTIELAQAKQYEKALHLVKADDGKQYMDHIRLLIGEFIHTEELLLEKRKNGYKEHKTTIMTLLYVEIAVIVLLAFIIFVILHKSFFEPFKILIEATNTIEKGKALNLKNIIPQDEMGYLLTSFYSMSEKIMQREKSLTYTAQHDELTSLPNRVKLYENIESSIHHADTTQTQTFILFMDLDKFKEVNDTLGHEAGDVLLKEVASRFQSVLREDDSLYRIGGDEFLIIVQYITSIKQVQRIINKILSTTKEPVIYNENTLQISVSIGVSSYPKDADSKEYLIKTADVAMYTAKIANESFAFFEKSMLKRCSDK